ncbi:MAG TPA: tetratricopeptide repeat protein, partial [Bacteroidales bacterium]|nr:tetratricopeptide repeat protein [Bacteroidales bacterium]
MKIKQTLFIPIFIILSIVISTTTVYSQPKNFAQAADEAYKLKQYAVAIDLYKKAYSKVKKNKTEKNRLLFMIAECYRMKGDTKNAETSYRRVVKANYPDPIAILYYADALKANGNYPDAIIQYNAYKEKVPSDPRGSKGAESCMLAQKWIDNPTRYEISNEKKFNTREGDFAPAWADKKYKAIMFTSNREGSIGNRSDDWTGDKFTDIWITTQSKGGVWSTPTLLDEDNINTPANEGTAILNSSGNIIYFTRCPMEKKKQLGCQIFEAKKKGKGWGIPELIDIASDSFTVGHPSLSANELELYFSSNMPGGYGGKDIWVIKRSTKSKPWGKPENLGPSINTEGDEMYPFIREDGVLYFSSNGHIGMGGLDIFKVEKVGDTWGTPENMKYPINSEADDFGIIFLGTKEEGYFSSNRKGGRGNDDIYYFIKPPLIFTLKGKVTDEATGKIIHGAIISCIGSDGSSYIDTTNAAGGYEFDKTQILENTSYVLTVKKDGYFGNRGTTTTVGLTKSTDLVLDFVLTPIPVEPIVLPEILYDLDDWKLKPQYQDSLNGLYDILVKNENITIELGSHTDTRASKEYNYELSQKRAQSV